MKVFKFFLFLIMLFALSNLNAAVRYVSPTAAGSANGSSWANASNDLQGMINASVNGDQIWVAAGEYQPTAGQTFIMKEGVKIYGGFSGTEGFLTQRNFSTNITTLKGNGALVINNNRNGLTPAAVLDGFTITGGNHTLDNRGGGMYNGQASPTISNCIFIDNIAKFFGGGMYNETSSPIISNCTFISNRSESFGGGMFNNISSPVITNCTFSYNIAISSEGGGMSNDRSSPIIRNSKFINNSANNGNGGGIENFNHSVPKFTNCLITGNSALKGGALYSSENSGGTFINCTITDNITMLNGGVGVIFDGGSHTITNSIIYGNSGGSSTNILLENGAIATITYSDIQIPSGVYSGTGNINADPKFVSTTNYQLQATSPCINVGNNAVVPSGVTTDLEGNKRIKGGAVDMGAYESNIAPAKLYVDSSILLSGNGTSWATALKTLNEAMDVINESTGTDSIFVAKGTYQPAVVQSFSMKEGVKILGGYPSGGGMRDWVSNVTTLKGNGSRVIYNYNIGLTSAAVLDGFTITGGNGSGMYNGLSSPTISNCTFTGNAGVHGGGMFNNNASPTIINCIFSNNTAQGSGGGMCNVYSSITITNSTFINNTASNTGGGISNEFASATIINCTISNNTSTNSGGGIFNKEATSNITNCLLTGNTGMYGAGLYSGENSSGKYINCTIAGNTATTEVGGIYIEKGIHTITNSIIYGNAGGSSPNILFENGAIAAITYSDIQIPSGVYAGTGNINADPHFVSTTNFQLKSTSPCINVGNSAAVPSEVTTDLNGNPRIRSIAVDMGVYEWNRALPVTYLSFEAKIINTNKAQLKWKVSNEQMVLKYIVEKSFDGIHYSTLGEIPFKVNSISEYQFIDEQLSEGHNYYRIVQQDLDGSKNYSDVRRLEYKTNRSNSMSVSLYPNPASNILNMEYYAGADSKLKVWVVDNLSRVVISEKTKELNKGRNKHSLNIGSLADGVYYLGYRLDFNGEIHYMKFIKSGK